MYRNARRKAEGEKRKKIRIRETPLYSKLLLPARLENCQLNHITELLFEFQQDR